MTHAARAGTPSRLVAVDAFRGATLMAMILVNNPGDWGHVYAPLLHATWHGWTLTDLVFPFFLFIVGVSIVLALGPRLEAGIASRVLMGKAARRAAILFALGLFLSGYPFGLFGPRSFDRLLETWRIPGVLQRIAVCYFLASVLYLHVKPWALRGWTAACLLGYWLLMTRVPVPGLGAPDLASKGDHWAGWLDRAALGSHVWSSGKVYDPEGILSTIPALATTLFGVLAGLELASSRGPVEKVARLMVRGATLVALGYVWAWSFPINKALWTSSYAVFTAGQALIVLGVCLWCFDVRDERPWTKWLARPLTTFGVNAITVFVGSGVLAKTMLYVKPGGVSLHAHLFGGLFASWLPPYAASLAFALTWVAAWYAVLALMARRGWVIKV